MRVVAFVVLAACACPSKPAGVSSGSGPVATPGGCEGVRAKIEQLYRADATASEPKRVDEAVADNTAMVMTECASNPSKVSACVSSARTAKELETSCLAALDDDGSEGDRFAP
jgi:hypothetical protein